MSISSEEELVKELSVTRKALALTNKKLADLEQKIDWFTAEEEQRKEEARIRRRERCWS